MENSPAFVSEEALWDDDQHCLHFCHEMKKHTVTEARRHMCSLLRESEKEEVLITRHGRPAAIIIGDSRRESPKAAKR